MSRCQECGRRLIDPESMRLGVGPVCVERMRARGLIVGGTRRRDREAQMFPSLRRLRRRRNPGQFPLEGMEP